ncbi:hypothetical protein [Streptosporangium sp. OZ121]|uniref:hypothetical protein n=1 Tax=Streptosporangium sp. OZ121 TaxID=3444183 RepID=UPI003F79CDBC
MTRGGSGAANAMTAVTSPTGEVTAIRTARTVDPAGFRLDSGTTTSAAVRAARPARAANEDWVSER